MKKVILHSAFSNNNKDIQLYNILYTKECINECFEKNELPIIFEITNITSLKEKFDEIKDIVVYIDLGIEIQNQQHIRKSIIEDLNIEYRNLKNFSEFQKENEELFNKINKKNETDFINDFLKTY